MKTPSDASLPKIADAAFHQVTLAVIERAESTHTKIIVWEVGQIKELDPQEARRRLNANLPAKD